MEGGQELFYHLLSLACKVKDKNKENREDSYEKIKHN